MPNDVEFQYALTDTGWASGFIRIDQTRFEFVCSYLFHNPLEEFLKAVYQLLPGLAAFPRKELRFTMLDEPVEYTWEFNRLDQTHVAIRVFEKGYDVKTVFEEKCDLNDLVGAIIQCMMRNPELRKNEVIERMYQELKEYVNHY
ncbi:hypothetical protein LCL96_02035 [Rossellomorea aquimaris]|uniref:hypothetical protein n=1 Tax=Rossellomorea aquimaris TaxID=189382 RepID=UPI001CD4F66B|nr:hypothetical protein [Rossellomorea aquimaris]MCA1057692.1 hypothetical protein [Rossellomorea aquimaris]